MGINRVALSGNLTREPELRATNGGMQVLSFGIAVNDRVRNQATGEWEDRANFVDCTMFGNRAEALARYLGKGAKVALEGRLRYRQWEAQDGSKRSKLEVVADNVDLMQQPRQDGYGGRREQQPRPQAERAPQAAPDPYASDDIPF